MSAKEAEIYQCFLLARDGYCCNICKKSVEELIATANLKDKLSGTPRKLSVFVKDHIDGDSSHHHSIAEDGSEIYCGNIQHVCHRCNQLKSIKQNTSQADTVRPSREKLDALRGKPTFHRNLTTYLMDNEHICFEEIKLSSELFSKGLSEITCIRYFRSELITKSNPGGAYQKFPHQCSADHCNGVHVCLRGYKPLELIANEKKVLNYKYNKEYMDGDEQKFNQYSGNWNKPFILFTEYYMQRKLLGNHQFI